MKSGNKELASKKLDDDMDDYWAKKGGDAAAEEGGEGCAEEAATTNTNTEDGSGVKTAVSETGDKAVV